VPGEIPDDHKHRGEQGHRYDHHGHGLNLRAAYVHAVADAAVSILAIAALLAGREQLGWRWMEPVETLWIARINRAMTDAAARQCPAGAIHNPPRHRPRLRAIHSPAEFVLLTRHATRVDGDLESLSD
jgi:hypothetical protein